MSKIHLFRVQQRMKLAERVDRITQTDRRFFERYPIGGIACDRPTRPSTNSTLFWAVSRWRFRPAAGFSSLSATLVLAPASRLFPGAGNPGNGHQRGSGPGGVRGGSPATGLGGGSRTAQGRGAVFKGRCFMSGPDDPFSFDAEFGDPDYVKSARDPNLPPQTGKEWVDCRASDIPVTEGGERSPFADLDDEFGTSDAPASQERTGERAGTDDQNPADDFSDEFERRLRRQMICHRLPALPWSNSRSIMPAVAGRCFRASRRPRHPSSRAAFTRQRPTKRKSASGGEYWPKAMIGVPMGPRIRRLGSRSRSAKEAGGA